MLHGSALPSISLALPKTALRFAALQFAAHRSPALEQSTQQNGQYVCLGQEHQSKSTYLWLACSLVPFLFTVQGLEVKAVGISGMLQDTAR